MAREGPDTGRFAEGRARDAASRGPGDGDRTAFLLRAGDLLDASLDYETRLATLAQIAVPELADWCVVDMAEPDGQIKRLAVAHVDPRKQDLGWALARRAPVAPDDANGAGRAIRESESQLTSEITDGMLQAAALDDEHLRLLRDMGLSSAMIVPLRACGQTLGALTLVSAESGPRYDEQDLALAEDFGRRCALAAGHARL